jgi:hypothetical protein
VTEQSRRSLFLTEGFVLAFLSAFSYLVAYIYENAYAEPFGIPAELIDLRWTTLFAAAGINVLLAIGVMGTIAVAATAALKVSKTKQRVLSVIAPLSIFALPILYAFGLSKWRFVLAIISAAAVVATVFEIASHRFIKPHPRNEIATKWGFKLALVMLRQPEWAIFAIFVMVMTLAFAQVTGLGNAFNTRDFLMTSGSPSAVVVRVYGDKIVTVQYDREAKALIPIYRVLPLTDSGRVFSMEHLPNVMPVCAPISSPEDSAETRVNRFIDHYLVRNDNLGRCERYRALRTPASGP